MGHDIDKTIRNGKIILLKRHDEGSIGFSQY